MTRILHIRRASTLLAACAPLLAATAAHAETYYVRNGGDNSADGLSDATAWATVAKVNQHSFAPGDDVYFRCGDTWTAQALIIDWSGTAQDRAEVGAYYLAGGQETVGVNGDGRPLFDGDWVDIAGINLPLVDLRAEYVTVQDVHVYNSYGLGIRISGGFTHNIVRRCKADRTGRAAIGVFSTSDNVVEYCEASRASIHWTLGNLTAWGSTIAVYNSPNNVVRYCEAHDNVGEGINLVRGSHGSVAEFNYVWANRSVGIYVDSAADCTVRHNLVVGTTDPTHHYQEGWHGMGIAVNNEVTTNGASDRTTFFGNVIIGRLAGIRFMNAQSMPTTDVQVVHNTLIDNRLNYNISSPDTFSNVVIRNNISYVNAADADHGAIHTSVFGSGSTMDHNFWSSEPHAKLYDAASDIVADPGFPKSSGWRELAGRDSFATADFSLLADSPAVDRGLDLGVDFQDGMTVGSDFHATPPTVETIAQGDAGDGWDLGAWVYSESAAGGAGGGVGSGGSGGSAAGGAAAGGQGAAPGGAAVGPDDEGGCSCRAGLPSHHGALGWLSLLLALGVTRRRACDRARELRPPEPALTMRYQSAGSAT